MNLDAAGWLEGAQRIASPNCDERPAGVAVELVVVHGISLPPGAFDPSAVMGLFANGLSVADHPYFASLSALRVSAHFLVARDGRCWQFVSCQQRAWHAGVSSWRGRGRCNDYSVGIELEGTDNLPYESAQYATCAALIAALARSYPLQAVVGHSDIAPGRKTDPGPCFDWARLPRYPRA